MLCRTPDFLKSLGLSSVDRQRVETLAQKAADMANGMTHLEDYRALGAICLDLRPRRIFEIGTFLGITSNYFLDLLPNSEVVSIAYCRNRLNPFARKYNNSSMSAGEVGSRVTAENRKRFHQLLGDSHALTPSEMLREFGPFDLIFIDGDHSRAGVSQDTDLARAILTPHGGICWHDANPAEKYLDVRQFLEQDLPWTALATPDSYVGGVAYWHESLGKRGVVSAPRPATRAA